MTDDRKERIIQEAKEVEQEETTLIRIVEWMDWIPAELSKVVGAGTHMSNGFTSFQTLKNERLIDLGVSSTGKNYRWEEEETCEICNGHGEYFDEDRDQEEKVYCDNCNGTGTITVEQQRGLYAFQAILAQNTSRELATALQRAQAQPMLEEIARDEEAGRTGRDKRDDLVVVQNPNRNDRRGNKSRKKR